MNKEILKDEIIAPFRLISCYTECNNLIPERWFLTKEAAEQAFLEKVLEYLSNKDVPKLQEVYDKKNLEDCQNLLEKYFGLSMWIEEDGGE